MTENVVGDLSKVVVNVLVGPDGKSRWGFSSPPERNIIQQVAYQRLIESFLAVSAAEEAEAEDIDAIVAHSDSLKVRVAEVLLTNRKTGKHPTHEEAVALAEGGFTALVLEADAKFRGDRVADTDAEEREDIAEDVKAFDLDAYRKRIKRPTPGPRQAARKRPTKKKATSKR